MDFSALLKGEIAKKKKEATELAKDGKIKVGEVERHRMKEYEEQSRLEEEARDRKRKQREDEARELHEEYERKRERQKRRLEQEKLDMTKDEVVAALRELNEPATIFGESDADRYRRMKKCKARKEYDQRVKDEDTEDYIIDPVDISKDQDRVNLQVRAYIRHLLAIYDNPELRSSTIEHLEPLLELLRKQKLEHDIFVSLATTLQALQAKKYKEANEAYMKLSIGNAAWPVGVAAIGIHARSNQSRTSGAANGANIMKSETARQWITAIKRLITFLESTSN